MPTDSELRDQLHAHDLKVTRARLAVLRVLHRIDGPSSHPEVTAALAIDGWDRSTLYRNLIDLAEAGILHRLDLGDRVWRYELAGLGGPHDAREHPHFLCTECGDIACLDGVDLVLGGPVPASVTGGRVAVQLRGVCDDCGDAAR